MSNDYMIHAMAAHDEIRAYAITARDTVEEARADHDSAAIHDEIGDLLFSVVNLARHLKVDPETALRSANAKFDRRFRFIEQALRDTLRPIESCTLEDLDALWGEAKRQEKNLPSCG